MAETSWVFLLEICKKENSFFNVVVKYPAKRIFFCDFEVKKTSTLQNVSLSKCTWCTLLKYSVILLHTSWKGRICAIRCAYWLHSGGCWSVRSFVTPIEIFV